MILSMTGYGRAQGTYGDKHIIVELRALNSKYSDVRLKIPQNYRPKEVELRKLIANKIKRGKVDVTIDFRSLGADDDFAFNRPLFVRYYQELSAVAADLDLPKGDLMQTILRIPNVVSAGTNEIEEQEWHTVLATLEKAVEHFDVYRSDEGLSIKKDLEERIHNIQQLLTEIEPFEKERIPKVRQRMTQNLEEFLGKENVDKNRFEQEVLFYLEKIDINEEKVRLGQHCAYFLEELNAANKQKGRKLSFIGQEMGREINTLGSKAYSSDIQRFVVKMKDELEKIKEQVANSV